MTLTDERYGCYTCGQIRAADGPASCECPERSFDWGRVLPASYYADELRGHREGRFGENGIDNDLRGIDHALSSVRVFRDDLNRGAIFDDRYGPGVDSADRAVAALETVRESAKAALRLLDGVQSEIDALCPPDRN